MHVGPADQREGRGRLEIEPIRRWEDFRSAAESEAEHRCRLAPDATPDSQSRLIMTLGTGWGRTGIGYKRPQGQLNGICKLFPTIRRDHPGHVHLPRCLTERSAIARPDGRRTLHRRLAQQCIGRFDRRPVSRRLCRCRESTPKAAALVNRELISPMRRVSLENRHAELGTIVSSQSKTNSARVGVSMGVFSMSSRRKPYDLKRM